VAGTCRQHQKGLLSGYSDDMSMQGLPSRRTAPMISREEADRIAERWVAAWGRGHGKTLDWVDVDRVEGPGFRDREEGDTSPRSSSTRWCWP
jgi:hypothetical protein